MRQAHSLHNPFVNRFNDPVTRRHDEMQSHEYMVWLRERNESGIQTKQLSSLPIETTHPSRLLASVIGLLVLILSFGLLLRVF